MSFPIVSMFIAVYTKLTLIDHIVDYHTYALSTEA